MIVKGRFEAAEPWMSATTALVIGSLFNLSFNLAAGEPSSGGEHPTGRGIWDSKRRGSNQTPARGIKSLDSEVRGSIQTHVLFCGLARRSCLGPIPVR